MPKYMYTVVAHWVSLWSLHKSYTFVYLIFIQKLIYLINTDLVKNEHITKVKLAHVNLF